VGEGITPSLVEKKNIEASSKGNAPVGRRTSRGRRGDGKLGGEPIRKKERFERECASEVLAKKKWGLGLGWGEKKALKGRGGSCYRMGGKILLFTPSRGGEMKVAALGSKRNQRRNTIR